jgi:DNA-binding MarR family transcriptional regulator
MIHHVPRIVQVVEPVEALRYLVLAAQRDGNRALAARLRPLGLTPAQAEVISVLAADGGALTVRQIGERLVCEPGSPSRLVTSLVEAGSVARRAHPEDGRATALELTPRGREAAERIRAVEQEFHADLRARLDPDGDDLEAALRVLRQISDGGASSNALQRRFRA